MYIKYISYNMYAVRESKHGDKLFTCEFTPSAYYYIIICTWPMACVCVCIREIYFYYICTHYTYSERTDECYFSISDRKPFAIGDGVITRTPFNICAKSTINLADWGMECNIYVCMYIACIN